MAQMVGKYAAKKMLGSQLKKYSNKEPAGQYDPYYEYRIDPRTGKEKKYKKQIPAYIPSGDASILASVRKRAYRLDMSLFNLFGIRFGWSSVIGFVPAIGDAVDGAMSLMVIRKCNSVEGGLPQSVLLQMLMWCVLDFLIGLVPFLGDLLDASIKVNTRNVRLLEQHLDEKYKPKEVTRRQREEAEAAKRRNHEHRPHAPATVYEDMSDDDELPRYSSRTHSPAGGPRRPGAAHVPVDTLPVDTRAQEPLRNPARSGSKRHRDDLETGNPPVRNGSRRH